MLVITLIHSTQLGPQHCCIAVEVGRMRTLPLISKLINISKLPLIRLSDNYNYYKLIFKLIVSIFDTN